MDFSAADRSVLALLVEARLDAEALLEEADYWEWQQLIERRAARDWAREFDVRIDHLLAHVRPGTERGSTRAAKELKRSFKKLLAFTPSAVLTDFEDSADAFDRDSGVVRCSPASWPRLDAIRAEVRGLYDKLLRLMQVGEIPAGSVPGRTLAGAKPLVTKPPVKKATVTLDLKERPLDPSSAEQAGIPAATRDLKDGPFDPFAVRIAGREARGVSPLRYRLIQALWDVSVERWRPARDQDDAIRELYGEGVDVDDKDIIQTFKGLVRDTNTKVLKTNGLIARLKIKAGKVWLEILSP